MAWRWPNRTIVILGHRAEYPDGSIFKKLSRKPASTLCGTLTAIRPNSAAVWILGPVAEYDDHLHLRSNINLTLYNKRDERDLPTCGGDARQGRGERLALNLRGNECRNPVRWKAANSPHKTSIYGCKIKELLFVKSSIVSYQFEYEIRCKNQMFWKKQHSKLVGYDSGNNSEYLAQKKRLFETPLYVPVRHKIELPDDDDGLGWASGLRERRWAFKYFNNFDIWINELHDDEKPWDIGPWRLEQRSDPFLLNFGIDDGPIVGLRFRIFYNSESVGDLEICPFSEPTDTNGIEENDFQAGIYICVLPAPFISYSHLSGFLLACLERFMNRRNSRSHQSVVSDAITAALWECTRTDNMWSELNLTYFGFVEVGKAT